MKTRLSHITVVLIATIGLLGSAARADLISMDFQGPENSAYTESGINTGVNGYDSLSGQDGLWNVMLVGTSAAGYETPLYGEYTSGTLKNGAGIDTSVSFVINTNLNEHWAHWDASAFRALQRDMVGVHKDGVLDWQLSNLETNTLYRLRMFGREGGASDTVYSPGKFTAVGSTTDYSFNVLKRNYCDLWVKSTTGGVISGIFEGMGDAGAWSGMQIEWNVEQSDPAVISIDLGSANPAYQGTPASGTVPDMNGDLSLPGQFGPWNELLAGDVDGTIGHVSTLKTMVEGLLDGDENVTTVSFTFNTGNNRFINYPNSQDDPSRDTMHRDVVYVVWPANTGADKVAYWQIDGLKATTEYTLKLFGYQTSGSPVLFSDFSATGLNTASGSTSLLQNYVDLVVTSTVSGQVTGILTNQLGQAGSTFAGIQIQGQHPLASDLISIDFETADTDSKTATASGAITDSLGDTSFAQAGVWNSMISGATDGGYWQSTTLQPIINNMFDGEGNATTVDFQFNTGSPVEYYVFGGLGELLGDTFTLLNRGYLKRFFKQRF